MFVLVEEQPVVETEAAEIVARDASVDNMINPEDREVQVILLYLTTLSPFHVRPFIIILIISTLLRM